MEPLFQVVYSIGIFSCALSSAMIAVDRECDLFGVVFIAFCNTFGGGALRDLFLGISPPMMFWQESIFDLLLCTGVALSVFLFAALMQKTFLRYEKTIARVNNVTDALGVGAFAVYGTQVALKYGFTKPIVAIAMGLVTGIVGGIIRDLCLNDVPFVLRKRVYALAALAGAVVYYILTVSFILPSIIPTVVGVLTTFGLRILATIFKWNFPVAIRFSKLAEQGNTAPRRRPPVVPIRKPRKRHGKRK